jgi:hypothetical protein
LDRLAAIAAEAAHAAVLDQLAQLRRIDDMKGGSERQHGIAAQNACDRYFEFDEAGAAAEERPGVAAPALAIVSCAVCQ